MRKSEADMMFLASNICCVSSGTPSAENDPDDVRGAQPTVKKCSLGKGTRFTANFRRSELSCPGKRKHVVRPDMTCDTRPLRSLYDGLLIPSERRQISLSASLSRQKVSSACSTSWWIDRVALYGSTMTSDTFGDGSTENVAIMRSGNSSRTLASRRVPMPEPVPPPIECVSWKP